MRIEAYCDESRQDYMAHDKIEHRSYVLIGSLWLETAHRNAIKDRIRELRIRHNLYGEFKWTRVSPSRLIFYQNLVDLFFTEQLRFRCIVLPADQLDAITFHGGDNELMFYKFYYLMLQAWILDFNTYRFFLDMKTNRVHRRLPKLSYMWGGTIRGKCTPTIFALPLCMAIMLLCSKSGRRRGQLRSSRRSSPA